MSIQAIPTGADPVVLRRARVLRRIDRFVRVTSPQILRLALQPECADLLEELAPLDEPGRGDGWRSVAPPLQRYRVILRSDRADLLTANYDRESAGLFRGAGSDAVFVETHLPHIAAEARLVARSVSSHAGRDIANTVRLAAVVVALSAVSLDMGPLPQGLIAVDDDVAAFTRPPAKYRVMGSTAALPNLLGAYLQAKAKETA